MAKEWPEWALPSVGRLLRRLEERAEAATAAASVGGAEEKSRLWERVEDVSQRGRWENALVGSSWWLKTGTEAS